MANYLFVAVLAAAYLTVLFWACRNLPREEWQVAAALPVSKVVDGSWTGVNLTFYGVLQASAATLAVALMLFMMGTVGVPALDTFLVTGPLLSVCYPASRWVAAWVEKKPQTLTVGGASFVGLILAPWLTLAGRQVLSPAAGPGLNIPTVLAALTIAYAFGEGLGRLACISFGCCYGKPLDQCSPLLQRLFKGHGFIFTGDTKKIAYESGLAGQPVLPIQAITSAFSVTAGLIGLTLFLDGHFLWAFLNTLVLTQGWRALSETVRSDFRGGGRISAYQVMALAAVPYGIGMVLLFPTLGPLNINLSRGFKVLWDPALLLLLEMIWLFIMVSTGRSRVTSATISFHVQANKI